jgi:outer membrane protein OmpA-like peptidoglycan-associated protein
MYRTSWLRSVSIAALLILSAAARGQSPAAVTDMTRGTPTAEDVVRALTITDAATEGEKAIAIDVKFEFNSAQLSPGAQSVLNVLGVAMNSPELARQSFRVEGHTDVTGSAVHNQQLSEARANSVYGYLVQKGVEAKRLTAKGFGSNQPLDPANPASPANRRVQIVSIVAPELAATSPPPAATAATTIPVKFTYKLHHLPRGAAPGQVVDPQKTAFRTGDTFFLEFGSSVTGIFDVWNLTPGGTVNKLGRWTSDAAKPLRLPPDGTQIRFTGTTGQELLVIQYYPCKPDGARNLELAPEVEQKLIDCARIGERPFKDDRNRDLEVVSGPTGATAEAQVAVATPETWPVSMVQFTVPLKHQ